MCLVPLGYGVLWRLGITFGCQMSSFLTPNSSNGSKIRLGFPQLHFPSLMDLASPQCLTVKVLESFFSQLFHLWHSPYPYQLRQQKNTLQRQESQKPLWQGCLHFCGHHILFILKKRLNQKLWELSLQPPATATPSSPSALLSLYPEIWLQTFNKQRFFTNFKESMS